MYRFGECSASFFAGECPEVPWFCPKMRHFFLRKLGDIIIERSPRWIACGERVNGVGKGDKQIAQKRNARAGASNSVGRDGALRRPRRAQRRNDGEVCGAAPYRSAR
jgi:hypothetical protein